MPEPVHSVTLTAPLSGRDAVADALYRCIIGMDTANDALFKSSFTTDAIFDLNGTIIDGFDAINSQCYAIVAKLDTGHYVSNLRINITDDESKAQLTCSSMAQHYPGGEGMKADSVHLLAGGFYYLDLVKDSADGLWKIKHWTVKSTWSQGDYSVVGR